MGIYEKQLEHGRKDAGGADDMEKVVKELARISDQVKEHGEKALAEAKTATGVAQGTKEKVDELLTQQGELKARIQELEQKAVRGNGGGGDSESIQTVLAAGQAGIKDFVDVRGQSKHVNLPISRKALTNSGVTGTALSYPGAQVLATPLSPLVRRLTVRDLLMPGRISGPVAFYQRESGYTNNAAPVSEGSLKPKSEITFELITEAVRTIAHLQDISLQMLTDIAYIESYIQSRMTYGLKLVEEAQLLTGSGVGQNLEGIYTAATAYSAPSGATINGQPAGGANETDLDKLRLALLQVELAYASTTGIVLHPTDWASIELLKDSTGQYLFTNPQNTTTGRIWGRDVVSTPALTQGRFLVGDFAMHAQILDREDANIAISFENKDNFERNMATLRVEERLALAIYRPEAFVKGVLESAS
jgi:HK97 family phage major capsid protein